MSPLRAFKLTCALAACTLVSASAGFAAPGKSHSSHSSKSFKTSETSDDLCYRIVQVESALNGSGLLVTQVDPKTGIRHPRVLTNSHLLLGAKNRKRAPRVRFIDPRTGHTEKTSHPFEIEYDSVLGDFAFLSPKD